MTDKENKITKMEEIKMINSKDLSQDFYLDIPKKLYISNHKYRPSKVRLRRIIATTEYVYCPPVFNLRGTFLTIEELEAIVKKLKELNTLNKSKANRSGK